MVVVVVVVVVVAAVVVVVVVVVVEVVIVVETLAKQHIRVYIQIIVLPKNRIIASNWT